MTQADNEQPDVFAFFDRFPVEESAKDCFVKAR